MPLDTGAVTHNFLKSAKADPAPLYADNAGGMMRAARQQLGLSLQDLAEATRIKRPFLLAIEEMRLEDLPSRPFTLGYVRAYAIALNLNPEEMVERFKQDSPGETDDLKPPIGPDKQTDPRVWLIGCAATVLICAVVVWNLAKHGVADPTQPASSVREAAAPAQPALSPSGVVTLSAATPPPQESTLPTPYQTPGMASASGVAVKPAAAAASIDPNAAPTFTPHGAVYGSAGQGPAVTLQARKSVSLVVRTPQGAVVFAQQLKAGEAYQSPVGADVIADVSDPTVINLYVNGQIRPGLVAELTPLGHLGAPAGG